jgi:hypothetical protein
VHRYPLILLLMLFYLPLLRAQTGFAVPPTWQSCEGEHPRFSNQPAAINGMWYAYRKDGTEESWEFWGRSFFRHSRISKDAWADERGRFQIAGGRLILHITSKSDARLGDSADGGTHCLDQTRQLSLTLVGQGGADGLVIDGLRLKPISR